MNRNNTISCFIPIPKEDSISAASVVVKMDINGEIETATKLIPIRSTKDLKVRLFPEGGSVGCDMPNRIYYEARDENNQPVRIRSVLVKEDGSEVGRVNDGNEGRGVSDVVVVPQGEKIALKVVEPQEFKDTLFWLPSSTWRECMTSRCERVATMRAVVHDNQVDVHITSPSKGYFTVLLFALFFSLTHRKRMNSTLAEKTVYCYAGKETIATLPASSFGVFLRSPPYP